MTRLIVLISGFIIFSICVLQCSKTSAPEPPDETFYIDLLPDSVAVDIGDTLTLTGSINSVENLFAISFDLVYDTVMVDFLLISLPSNSILGSNSINFSNRIDGGVSVSIGRTQSSRDDNISASGPIFVVKFIAIGSGTTAIQYRDVYIIDENGIENGDLAVLEMRGAGVDVR
jgi:hypothetical protein